MSQATNSNDVILNQKNDLCHFVTDNPQKAQMAQVPQRVKRAVKACQENGDANGIQSYILTLELLDSALVQPMTWVYGSRDAML